MHQGKFYRLSSSCYAPKADGSGGRDLSREYGEGDENVRADVLYSLCLIEREPDSRIKMTYMTNMNVFMEVPQMIIDPFVSKSAKSWFENV